MAALLGRAPESVKERRALLCRRLRASQEVDSGKRMRADGAAEGGVVDQATPARADVEGCAAVRVGGHDGGMTLPGAIDRVILS